MAIKTVVKMNVDVNMSPVALELMRLEKLGVTVASEYVRNEDHTVSRTWNSMEAAQGWIDFLNGLTPGPVSAEIVVD